MLTRLTEDMKLIDDKMRTTASLINKYTTVKNFEFLHCCSLQRILSASLPIYVRMSTQEKFQKSCFWKINIVQIINDKGFLSLKESYETCSPGLVYSSWKAKTKLYQIPIATVGIGDLKKGNYQVFVCSKDSNLSLIKNLLTMKLQSETKMKSLDTHSVKAIF